MTGAIIQCRLGSTRLPAKAMLILPSRETILERIIHQAQRSYVDKVIVTSPDDIILDIAKACGARTFKRVGNEKSVFHEYVEAGITYGLDTIVRLTADCPMLTDKSINDALSEYRGEYYYNGIDGEDVEIFELSDLMNIKPDHENVTGNFYDVQKIVDKPTSWSIDELGDYLRLWGDNVST